MWLNERGVVCGRHEKAVWYLLVYGLSEPPPEIERPAESEKIYCEPTNVFEEIQRSLSQRVWNIVAKRPLGSRSALYTPRLVLFSEHPEKEKFSNCRISCVFEISPSPLCASQYEFTKEHVCLNRMALESQTFVPSVSPLLPPPASVPVPAAAAAAAEAEATGPLREAGEVPMDVSAHFSAPSAIDVLEVQAEADCPFEHHLAILRSTELRSHELADDESADASGPSPMEMVSKPPPHVAGLASTRITLDALRGLSSAAMQDSAIVDPDDEEDARLANEKTLFRTCPLSDILDDINTKGIDLRRETGGRFGRGIYLNEYPIDAVLSTVEGRSALPVAILCCRATLGKVREYGEGQYDPALVVEPAGAQSVHGGMRFGSGYVLYQPHRTLVTHVVVASSRISPQALKRLGGADP